MDKAPPSWTWQWGCCQIPDGPESVRQDHQVREGAGEKGIPRREVRQGRGERAFVVDKSDQVASSVPDIWMVGKGKGTRMVLLLRGH